MRTVRTGRGGGGSAVDEKGEHETRCHDEVESNAACSIEIVKIRVRGFYEIEKGSTSTNLLSSREDGKWTYEQRE